MQEQTKTALNVDALSDRLATLYAQTNQTPLFNPVGQLGFEISRLLEAGEVSIEDVGQLVADFERWAQSARADRLAALLQPKQEQASESRLADAVSAMMAGRSFDVFKNDIERRAMAWVFTAHPTFMFAQPGYDDLAKAAGSQVEAAGAVHDRAPTLAEEHEAALSAIGHATQAQLACLQELLGQAGEAFGAQWRTLRPRLFETATWVGYDMDGRTDIAWHTSLTYRLKEKARQLAWYSEQLSGSGANTEAVLHTLEAGKAHCQRQLEAIEHFHAGDLSLVDLSNVFSAPGEGRLTSLAGVISALESVIETADDLAAKHLIALVSIMRERGLGVGKIHFRINASQLNNAIRQHINASEDFSMASRSAFSRLRTALSKVEPVRSNIVAMAQETTTAVRQFLSMAQFLKHIDEDSNIRMLVAECEQPTTMLCALYFLRLFGIEKKVEISPLFETEAALEHGARFLDALLGDPDYQTYARAIGTVAIQTGFSDAGRFLGQIPAALAIERLQGRLAQLMAKHGLSDLSAIVFNTHGESMGRGAHPGSFEERLAHPLSAWSAAQFSSHDIALRPEVSFQGGDGYVFFQNDQIAMATACSFLETLTARDSAAGEGDPFYEDTDTSLDFYRNVRRFQRELFVDPDYNLALLGFGLSLLNPTGSRQSIRQSDLSRPGSASLRRVRAIPHNAVLQQLGYPVNVIGGIGEATEAEREHFADLVARSPRARMLLSLVGHSSRRASIKTMVAYGELFNGAFWATRPYRGAEPELEAACLQLAEKLTNDGRTPAFRRLATRLRVDGLKLRRLVDLLPDGIIPAADEGFRRRLGAMHALRIALMQHLFIKAAQIPAFSRRNDISRDDVLDLILSLRVDEASQRYRTAFPLGEAAEEGPTADEPSDYPIFPTPDYARIRTDFVDQIDLSFALIRRLGTAVSQCFSAHG